MSSPRRYRVSGSDARDGARHRLVCCLAFMLAVLAPAAVHALPRYALLTGTRCSACHVNPQGGSLRTELGFQTMNTVGAFDMDSLGLGWLAAGGSNTLADGMITFGLDTRLQVAKLGRPPNDVRRVIPMQVAPSIAIAPLDELVLYGTYNAGPLRYAGQTSFDAAIQYQPGITTPSIRVGYILPSVGLRYDDHTMYTRRDPTANVPLVAPNYNELGGEITYEGTRWLTVNVGVFSAHNLAKAEPTVDDSKPSYAARVMVWPRWLDEGINAEAGASVFMNGKFRMVNAFGGVGLADQATLQGEVVMAENADNRKVLNYSVLGSYQFLPWLTGCARYEHAAVDNSSGGTSTAYTYVVGAEIFPVPLFELRPEYRYTRTDAYILGQYTIQFRIFY